ncbi:MAG: NUDIX hydrolase, partial [Actinomycetota bacterium]|nr:NUDIX hydrolase [Actinomycetota bacterium]
MRGANAGNPESTIRVSAVVLRDDRGGVLTVRKRNTN